MKPDQKQRKPAPDSPKRQAAPSPQAPAVQGQAHGEHPEPRASQTFYTPLWLVALLGLMAYWGQIYIDHNGGELSPLVFNHGDRIADLEARVPRSEADALIVRGKKVYGTYCVACHQPSGLGLPGQFPPLVGSEWALADGPNRIIRIVLNGLTGPITVKGTEFNNTMLPWRDQLTDEDIAGVLTFVRSNKEWGHKAPPVTPAQVKAIRDATVDRPSNWTSQELLALPEGP